MGAHCSGEALKHSFGFGVWRFGFYIRAAIIKRGSNPEAETGDCTRHYLLSLQSITFKIIRHGTHR